MAESKLTFFQKQGERVLVNAQVFFKNTFGLTPEILNSADMIFGVVLDKSYILG